MIVFSAFIPNRNKLFVLEEFLNLARNNYGNHDIFIGFQVNTTEAVYEILDLYKDLKLHYSFSDEAIYLDSDVPGFQTALKNYYDNRKNISDNDGIVYFGHTKGVTTNNDSFRQYLFDKHFNNMSHINQMLKNEKVGCYGHLFSPINSANFNGKSYTDILKKWNNKLPYTVLNYFFVNTFFACKKHILDEFLDNIDYKFFTDNLKDRYFFERDFIHFVDMLGYIPTFDILEANNGWRYEPTLNDYEKILNQWKIENLML